MQHQLQGVSFRIVDGRHMACHDATTWNDSAPHADPFSRLYYIDGGRGRVHYAGRRVDLEPGHFYLFPAHRPIRHCASPGLDQFYIHFTAETPGVLPLFDLTEWRVQRAVESRARARQQMKRLVTPPQAPAELLEQQATLQWLVAGFLDSYRQDLSDRLRNTERFGTVVEYIHSHLDAEIRLPTLARLASLHPNYFSNQFTASFGVSPRNYILSRRVERAQFLLWHTDQPVKQVAGAVGYDNTAYFCRIFKRRTGMTPGTYRSQRG